MKRLFILTATVALAAFGAAGATAPSWRPATMHRRSRSPGVMGRPTA